VKNILILGGLGFIGSNLIEEFLQHEDAYSIIVFDFPGKHNPFGEKIRIIYGDFSNEESLKPVFSDNRIDIVIHLISTTVPASSNENIIYDIEANLIPTIQLLKLLSVYKIPEIIFFSSGGSVYGITKDEKVDENHSVFPVSSHGTIKITIEKYIHLFQQLYGIKYLILRVGNPYGPWQNSEKQGIINIFIRKMLRNEPLVVRGDGNAIRDYIFVKDLASIVHILISKEIHNEIINIGSGIGNSINQIIGALKKIVDNTAFIEYEEALQTDVPRVILDTKKLEKLISYPLCSIEEGIQKTYDSMIKNTF
jgi:UDP-glucose 4-epimerase